MKILLDPGHGAGRDHNRGSLLGNEGDNNFLYALALKKELEKKHTVRLTRKEITDNPSLKRRGEMAEGFDLFLSLHSNAAGSRVRGTEIYGDIHANDARLMRNLVDGLSQMLHTPNRQVRYRTRKDGKIYVCDQSPGGSNWYDVLYYQRARVGMLIEHVFHTNWEDCRLYVEKRAEIARCTARIIDEYFASPCARCTLNR